MMRSNKMNSFVVGLAFAATSGVAMANDVAFTMQQGGIWYTSKASTEKVEGGTEQKETTTGIETMPNSLFLQATWENISVYVYPTDNSMPLGVSYMPMKELEVGVNIGIDQTKADKAKTDSNTTKYGLFATYYLAAGPGMAELGLSFNSMTETGKGFSDDATPVKTNKAGTDIGLAASYVHELGKRFSYVGGLMYNIVATDNKEGKMKSSSNNLALNLASFRYTW